MVEATRFSKQSRATAAPIIRVDGFAAAAATKDELSGVGVTGLESFMPNRTSG